MKKKIRFVVIPLIIALLAFVIYNAAGYVFVENSINNRINTDIKRIDLSTVERITIKNDGREETLYPTDESFDIVKKAFDNKKLKKETHRYYEPTEGNYEITFHCQQDEYTVYGCPIKDSDGNFEKPVCFILYDYSNYDTMSYLYLYVDISENEFLQIF